MEQHAESEVATEWLAQLISIDKLLVTPSSGQGPKEYANFQLLLIQQGACKFVAGGKQVSLRAPMLYLLPSGMWMETKDAGQEPIEIYVLDFRVYQSNIHNTGTTSERIMYNKMEKLPVSGMINHSTNALKRLMLKLYFHRGDSATLTGRLRNTQRMARLLELLLSGEEVITETSTEEQILDVIHYMAEHIQEDMKIDLLSEMAGMQPSTFSKRFKQLMGKSPIEYLSVLRLNKAKGLLITRDYRNMREIAQNSGFQDEFYFSKRFKQRQGVSPSRYQFRLTEHTRIITLSDPYTEHLLALRLIPYAAHVPIWLHDSIPPATHSFQTKNPRMIGRNSFIEFQPDLILCKKREKKCAQSYIGDLAPVISLPWRTYDLYDMQRQLALMLGREEQAKQWRIAHQLLEEQARAALPAELHGAVLAVCVLHPHGWRLYGARNYGHVFYRSLGFQPPEQIRQRLEPHMPGVGFVWLDIDAEQLDQIKADFIVFVTLSDQGEHEIEHRLTHTDTWRTHPALLHSRYAVLKGPRWMVYAPLSIEWQLQQATAMFRPKK